MQWHIEIGIFNATSKARYFKKKILQIAAPVFCFFSFGFRFVFILLILFVCGDTELNSVPKNRNSCHNFSICHWNLNTIAAHNFAKANLLQAYNVISPTVGAFFWVTQDISCSEVTFLYSSSDLIPKLF